MAPQQPTFPDVMTLPEVAALMRITPKAITNSLSAGTFLPLPFAERPLRWRGEDVARWYRGEFREAIATLRKQARLRLKRAS